MPIKISKEAGEGASSWNAIIKLVGGIILFIGTGWGAWYKLQSHDAELKKVEMLIEQERIDRQKEDKLQTERSDKRNERNAAEVKELEEKGVDLMLQVTELRIQTAKLEKEVELNKNK